MTQETLRVQYSDQHNCFMSGMADSADAIWMVQRTSPSTVHLYLPCSTGWQTASCGPLRVVLESFVGLLQVLKRNGYGGKIDSKQWLRQVGERPHGHTVMWYLLTGSDPVPLRNVD